MTPAMSDRAFLSIGEVLDLLKAEFPDVTISKIRFLESQGLIDPERTPSGYRKFYESDVERLRWILRQQRENFLPLKVIKDRLVHDGDLVIEADPDPVVIDDVAVADDVGAAPVEAAVPVEAAAPAGDGHGAGLRDKRKGAGGRERSGGSGTGPGSESGTSRQSLAASMTTTTFTAEELGRASGLDPAELADLERFGLLRPRRVGGQVYFDEDDLAVARLAAGFSKHGVEARHLRMYATATAREAGFFEQVVVPLLKQRNPAARRQAVDTLADMVKLGEGLRSALLRAALREHMGTT